MKCSVCGTKENVREVKYLPMPGGRKGHITLTNRTKYCAICTTKESDKFTEMVDAAIKRTESNHT